MVYMFNGVPLILIHLASNYLLSKPITKYPNIHMSQYKHTSNNVNTYEYASSNSMYVADMSMNMFDKMFCFFRGNTFDLASSHLECDITLKYRR